MKKDVIALEPKYDLKPYISGAEIVAFNIGFSGEILVVLARKPLDYQEEKKNWAIFPKVSPKEAQSYEVLVGEDGEFSSLCTIENEQYNIHDVQLLPDRNVLLVCARSYYRNEKDFDENGRIYSPSGEFLDEILLGDGIQNTQSTQDGTIWTGFFDEGVFGNFGWTDPVGESGLIAWGSDGTKAYEFEPVESLDHICDCYALNVVSNTETWCYYYTEFPLVKIDGFRIADYWDTPVCGSDAFAIAHGYALFKGGYDEKDLYCLVKLKRNHKSDMVKTFELLDEASEPIRGAWVRGKGDSMYLLKDNTVYTFSVTEAML